MLGTVRVVFIDAASGRVLGEVDQAPEQLPASFAVATKLHLGDLDWSVESAEPSTREEFVKSKHLVLRLRRIERIDPKTLMFSLPSIENVLPAANGDPIDGTEIVFSEDDWRQYELVSRIHEDAIDAELDAIGEIHLHQKPGVGFEKIHVRERIPEPIPAKTLKLEDLGATTRSVTFRGAGQRIPGSFAVELSENVWLYGIHEDRDVRVLGVAIEDEIEEEGLAALEALEKRHNLLFVDWCSCGKGIRSFFSS